MNSPLTPFSVKDCTLISVALGVSAHNLRELRERIATVPLQSLYHHFYEALLRPSFDDPEFPNDFAQWARHQLHDAVVAERLGIVDPLAHKDREELRQEMVELLEDRIAEVGGSTSVEPGQAFQFLRSKLVIFDTGLSAGTPEELSALIPSLRPGSVFFHFVDARFRPPHGEDDFSTWLAQWGNDTDRVVTMLREIDVGFGSLIDLRERISHACMIGADNAEAAPADAESDSHHRSERGKRQ